MGITFNDMATVNEKSGLVVDGLNLSFRYRDYTNGFIDDYLKTVRSLARSYKTGRIIIAADQGSSSYRKSIYPEYKANRKEKYATQTPEEKEKFEIFFNNWEETVLVLQQEFDVLRFPGVEADDIAGYIVKNMAKFDFEQLWLISSDADWDLLLQSGVSRFSYVTRKEITIDNWFDKYECQPHQYVDLKTLMGDTGDNIKGVEGVGPKRALQLIQEYGSTFDIIESMPIPGKQKFIQALNASKDKLELNMKLVDILTYCEEAIGLANMRKIDECLAT